MGWFRRYGEFPLMFHPDEGEVVLAARSVAGPYLRAVVVKVRRASRDKLRVDFIYQEASDVSAMGKGVRDGEKGHAYISEGDRAPLIRRLPVNPSPHPGEGSNAA